MSHPPVSHTSAWEKPGRSDSRKTVSIIIAVYNGEAVLENCINSIAGQSWKDRELIVIDGGSCDGTIDILRRRQHDIDYWASAPDEGIYDALNKGIRQAHGEWLYFLGSDDVFVDDAVLSDVFSERHDSLMLYGDVRREPDGAIYDGEFDCAKIIRRNICHQAIFYHRDLFERFGLYERKYRILADWYFNLQLFAARKTTRPHYLKRVIARYSDKGVSSHTIDMAFIRERGRIVRSLFGFRMYLYFLRTCGLDQLNLTLRDVKRRLG